MRNTKRFNSIVINALVDLVVVFVGIFVALQVDQWRENRSFRHSETLFLQRLDEDLKEYLANAETILEFLSSNQKAVAHVYNSLASGEILDGDRARFERGLIYLGHLPTFTVNRSAYDEMVYSGMFARLSSGETRQSISRLFGAQERMEEHFSWWREMPLRLEEWLYPHVEYFSETGPDENGHKIDALIYEPVRRIRYDWSGLQGDPRIISGYYWAKDTHEDWLRLTTNLIEMTAKAQRLVAEELAKR